MTRITVEIDPKVVLVANGSHGHYQVKARKVAAIRQLAERAYLAAGSPSFDQQVRAVVHVTYPVCRTRDVHNLMPTAKALIDGMVGLGLLPDDNDAWLQGPDLRPAGITPGTYTFTVSFHEPEVER